jgi:hypothetical protein
MSNVSLVMCLLGRASGWESIIGSLTGPQRRGKLIAATDRDPLPESLQSRPPTTRPENLLGATGALPASRHVGQIADAASERARFPERQRSVIGLTLEQSSPGPQDHRMEEEPKLISARTPASMPYEPVHGYRGDRRRPPLERVGAGGELRGKAGSPTCSGKGLGRSERGTGDSTGD